ncbi:MAG: hypothetical protein V4739_02560 [Pseudomonadota bacterium]
MIHPVIHLLASRPELFADHVAGYGQLVAAQVADAASGWRQRALLGLAALLALVASLGLAGMALLIAAAVPIDDMPMPWLLVAVPLIGLAIAVVCGVMARRPLASLSLEPLRAQMAADKALLRELEEVHAHA